MAREGCYPIKPMIRPMTPICTTSCSPSTTVSDEGLIAKLLCIQCAVTRKATPGTTPNTSPSTAPAVPVTSVHENRQHERRHEAPYRRRQVDDRIGVSHGLLIETYQPHPQRPEDTPCVPNGSHDKGRDGGDHHGQVVDVSQGIDPVQGQPPSSDQR